MKSRKYDVTTETAANPYSGSSLVPMLVVGIILTFVGMLAAIWLT